MNWEVKLCFINRTVGLFSSSNTVTGCKVDAWKDFGTFFVIIKSTDPVDLIMTKTVPNLLSNIINYVH